MAEDVKVAVAGILALVLGDSESDLIEPCWCEAVVGPLRAKNSALVKLAGLYGQSGLSQCCSEAAEGKEERRCQCVRHHPRSVAARRTKHRKFQSLQARVWRRHVMHASVAKV